MKFVVDYHLMFTDANKFKSTSMTEQSNNGNKDFLIYHVNISIFI